MNKFSYYLIPTIFTKKEQHKGPICCQYAKEIYFHGDKKIFTLSLFVLVVITNFLGCRFILFTSFVISSIKSSFVLEIMLSFFVLKNCLMLGCLTGGSGLAAAFFFPVGFAFGS